MRQSAHGLALAVVALLTTLVLTPGHASDSSAVPVGEQELIEQLTDTVSSTHLGRATLGMSVVDVQTGRSLFGHNEDKLLTPASCMKLFTSYTALKELGPSYTFHTRLYTTVPMDAQGVVKGDLVVVGSGDPSLNLQAIWRVADLVRRAGVKQITGNIVIDSSFFDGESFGPGSEGFSENRAYTAPTGALSVNWNTVSFVVRPGEKPGDPVHVVLDPPTRFITFTNEAKTVQAGAKSRVTIIEPSLRTFQISGELALDRHEKTYYRAIHDPDAFAGQLIQEYLSDSGVTVVGKPKKGKLPANATEIGSWDSPPLSELVRLLNKHSNNFIAEQLTKTLAAEAHQGPGNTEDGVEVIQARLARIGIEPGSYSMVNGSGLSRDTKVTTHQLTTVLRAGWTDFQIQPEYLMSLPIAASDGTIQWRMGGTAAAGTLRAKTGTLRGVSCLAGFAQARNQRVLAFAVLFNDVDGSLARAVAMQDRIGTILSSWSGERDTPPPVKKAEAPAQEKKK